MCCARWTARRAAGLLIEASDGAGDGKRKLYNAAHARGLKPQVVECLTSAELGLALGRENVIHAAVQSGRLGGTSDLGCGTPSGLPFRRKARPARHERDA